MQNLSDFVVCLKFFISKNKLENIPKKLLSQSLTAGSSEKMGNVMEGMNVVFLALLHIMIIRHNKPERYMTLSPLHTLHTTHYTHTHKTRGSKSTLTKLFGLSVNIKIYTYA